MTPPPISTIGAGTLRHVADCTGMLASGLCLLHCVAFPFLLGLFPLFGVFNNSGAFHGTMVGIALAAALISLGPGYLKHRRVLIAAMGAAGVACLASAVLVFGPRYGEAVETGLTIAGAALLALAHLRNRACCGNLKK